ncbi:MAG: ABC transporter permease [Dehalococcoidia bacterium]|nr:ABC transporter permease [Dehalococcoidia bacterium]
MMSFAANITGEIFDTYLSIRFELKKHLRRKRLLIVAILAILMPLIFNVVPTVGDTDFTAYADIFAAAILSFITVLIVITAALFAGDAVSGEFENKTGLLLFSTTQSRVSIILGKYIAALLATFTVVSLYYAVTTLEIGAIYGVGEIPTELAQSYSLALLYSMSAVSVVFFFSSVLKRTISSTILGFVFLMMVLPIIETILQFTDIEPWFIVTYSSGLITEALGGIDFAFGPGGHGINSLDFTPDLNVGIMVMIAYTIIFFVSGMVVANKRSVE